jgi:hypothetical protein
MSGKDGGVTVKQLVGKDMGTFIQVLWVFCDNPLYLLCQFKPKVNAEHLVFPIGGDTFPIVQNRFGQ